MKALFVIILLANYFNCLAQTSDTLKIKTVEIFEEKNSSTILIKKRENLSELLKNQSTLFIKDYGPCMLSTITLRGLGANHTNVLWEGINIQNAMLGLNDLSLIPTKSFSSIKILNGNNSYLNSNGAFGGSINLDSYVPMGFKITLGSQFHSYQNLNSSICIENTHNKFWYRYTYFNLSAKNNFNYATNYFGPRQEFIQNHASQYLNGQIIELGRIISSSASISFKNWIQYSKRELPSPIGINNNNELQNDFSNRSLLKYIYSKKRLSLVNTSAYIHEKINYYNPLAAGNSDTSLNASNSIKNNLNLSYFLNQFLIIKSGLQSEFNKGVSVNYVKSKNNSGQNYFYFMPLFNYRNIKIAPTYKLAHYSITQKLYHIYNLNAEFNINNKFITTLNTGKNYRFPTLNDLYWNPGGNINLIPENGNLNEIHFMLSPFSKNSSYLKYTLYNNKIQNYILWQPGHHGYFTPQNLKEIWSRGFELEGLAEFNIQKINISNRSVYAYTKSTNLRSSIPNDESVGRQLMYTPIYNVKNIFTVRYKQFAFYNEYSLLSWRATSSDNYDYLPLYNLFNFGANFNINLKNNLLEINFALNNALNTSYEIIKNRPMPLRNFSISLNYTFTK